MTLQQAQQLVRCSRTVALAAPVCTDRHVPEQPIEPPSAPKGCPLLSGGKCNSICIIIGPAHAKYWGYPACSCVCRVALDHMIQQASKSSVLCCGQPTSNPPVQLPLTAHPPLQLIGQGSLLMQPVLNRVVPFVMGQSLPPFCAATVTKYTSGRRPAPPPQTPGAHIQPRSLTYMQDPLF